MRANNFGRGSDDAGRVPAAALAALPGAPPGSTVRMRGGVPPGTPAGLSGAPSRRRTGGYHRGRVGLPPLPQFRHLLHNGPE